MIVATRRAHIRRVLASLSAVLLVVVLLVATERPAQAATATGKTAVKTQLQPQAKITGVTPLLWVPAGTTLTLQCLAVGEKAYGAVAKANPYYYKAAYKGKTGYVSDSDLYTAKDATKLGLTYCSIPAQPAGPKAGSVTSSSVVLSWTDKSNNETSFKTQYSTDGGKSWKAGPSAGANAKSVKVAGLAAAKKYTLQVGASNNKGTKWSAYVTATTSKAAVAPKAASAQILRPNDGTYMLNTRKKPGPWFGHGEPYPLFVGAGSSVAKKADWTVDVDTADNQGIYARFKSAGKVTLKVEAVKNYCGSLGAGGKGVQIAVRVDDTWVGSVLYQHLSSIPADIAVGRSYSTTSLYLGKSYVGGVTNCWAGSHSHLEVRALTGGTCWSAEVAASRSVGGTPVIGAFGSGIGHKKQC